MEKFCRYCGTKMEESAKFCPNCGANTTEGSVDNQTTQNVQQPSTNVNTNTQQNNVNNNTTATTKWNGLAIASFVCSMVGIVIFGLIMGILAICFAAAAKSRAKTFPEESGKGFATAGLVVGIIEVIIMIWSIFVTTTSTTALYSMFH